MHLCFLSDGYLSDSIADAPVEVLPAETFGKAHVDGLIRGLVFAMALAVPLALTVALNPVQPATADTGPATHVRVTHLPKPALAE